ncbi:MAG: diguanylate cyclase [Candidatus Hydrogenedentes bacterium]|nr:diguanylate cyclase [Candidatus Hydrogenedentota bacterium]
MFSSDGRQSGDLSLSLGDSQPFSGKYVLIAEHHPRIAKYTRRILEKYFGCCVTVVGNGFEVMANLDTSSFDVFIYAMGLPGTASFKLLREARSACPDMGIIVTGENTSRFPYVEAVRFGATDFIAKPFLPTEIISKLVRIFNELELSKARHLEAVKYQSLFDLSIDGMALLDGGAAVIQDVNKSLLELMAEKKMNIVGKPVAMLLDAEERYRFEQWLSLCALIGRGAISDLKLAHTVNTKVYVDISMTVVKNEAQFGIFLVMKNVTERREMQVRLDEITQRDLLTGLLNRRSFVNRVHGTVRSAQEYNIPTTLMMIDVDGLKGFNDKQGHAVGDQMLVEVATAISVHIHPSTGEACFRFDGDEFALLLTGVDEMESFQVAKRIQKEFYSRNTRGLTISVGLAEYRNNQSVDEFISSAERAVHEAKLLGNSNISAVRIP